jgi:hypothetical protein
MLWTGVIALVHNNLKTCTCVLESNPSGRDARAGRVTFLAAWDSPLCCTAAHTWGRALCHCHARAARIPRRSVHPSPGQRHAGGRVVCGQPHVWARVASAPHARPLTHMACRPPPAVFLCAGAADEPCSAGAGHCLDGIHGPDGRSLFWPGAMISGPLFCCHFLLLLLLLTACSASSSKLTVERD